MASTSSRPRATPWGCLDGAGPRLARVAAVYLRRGCAVVDRGNPRRPTRRVSGSFEAENLYGIQPRGAPSPCSASAACNCSRSAHQTVLSLYCESSLAPGGCGRGVIHGVSFDALRSRRGPTIGVRRVPNTTWSRSRQNRARSACARKTAAPKASFCRASAVVRCRWSKLPARGSRGPRLRACGEDCCGCGGI